MLGGLWFDSLSANPLGVSVLPLFVVGLAIHVKRELIVRDQTFAQVVLGAAAPALAVPLLTLLLLLTTRPHAAARLGHALAAGRHERGRRHRDADLL